MQKKIKMLIGVAAIAAALASNPARAFMGIGDVVIDPSNLVKNTTTALSAIKTEVNTAATFIKQVEANISLARSLMSLQGVASLAGVQDELALYYKLKATSSQLANVIAQSRQLSQGLEARVGASKLSWSDFMKSQNAISQSASQGLAMQYQAIDQNMIQLANRRKDLMNKLQGVNGQTDATQAVGIGIDALIGQNQQMMAALRAKADVEQVEKHLHESDEALGMSILAERQKQLKASADKYK